MVILSRVSEIKESSRCKAYGLTSSFMLNHFLEKNGEVKEHFEFIEKVILKRLEIEMCLYYSDTKRMFMIYHRDMNGVSYKLIYIDSLSDFLAEEPLLSTLRTPLFYKVFNPVIINKDDKEIVFSDVSSTINEQVELFKDNVILSKKEFLIIKERKFSSLIEALETKYFYAFIVDDKKYFIRKNYLSDVGFKSIENVISDIMKCEINTVKTDKLKYVGKKLYVEEEEGKLIYVDEVNKKEMKRYFEGDEHQKVFISYNESLKRLKELKLPLNLEIKIAEENLSVLFKVINNAKNKEDFFEELKRNDIFYSFGV